MRNTIDSSFFGQLSPGETVTNYRLQNTSGITLEVLNYGGIIRKLNLPNRQGEFENCVLGFDNLEDYQTKSPYFGALVGRFGNRIAKGSFLLDGEAFTLAQNLGKHHLHGGIKGFDKVLWSVEEKITPEAVALELSYTSPHGEEGYPGKLETTVLYRLTNEDVFEVEYRATTDRKTLINLTQHSYFNLSGNSQNKILDHQLQLQANHILDVDAELIPTGELCAVQGTPFDFRTVKTVGQDIEQDNVLLRYGQGYDHCYCFDPNSNTLTQVAVLFHPKSGRKMEVFTTEPAMQLYTANHLAAPFVSNAAICLETQGYPDSPNHPHFPTAVLEVGEEYSAKTHFKFSIV